MDANKVTKGHRLYKQTVIGAFVLFLIGITGSLQVQAKQQQARQEMMISQNNNPVPKHQANKLNKIISVHLNDITLIQGLQTIAQSAGLKLVYSKNIVPVNKHVSLRNDKIKVKEALWSLLTNTGLNFMVSSNNHLVLTKSNLPPNRVKIKQAGAIGGTVTDAKTGDAIPGANIYLPELKKGAVTDTNGHYTINNVPHGTYTLRATFVGYKQNTKKIQVQNDKTTIVNFVLQTATGKLNQMVVIGYGSTEYKDITGSISTVSEKDLENAPLGSSVESVLQGRAAGVNVLVQSASPTSPISVVIRGASSLTGENQPLWVIDGVPQYTTETSGDVANTLYNLNLDDVKSINILKDASATAIYGSRAANGVVLVETKGGIRGRSPTIEISSKFAYSKQNFNNFDYFESPEYIRFTKKVARDEVFTRDGFDYFTRDYLDQQAWYDLNTSEYSRNDLTFLPGTFRDSNTDWLGETTRNPINMQQNLSLRGGTENLTYFFSLNHNQQQGIVKTGDSELYGGRLNLTADIHQDLKFGLQLSGSDRTTDNKDYLLEVIKKIRPDIPPFNEDGSLYTEDPYTENPFTSLQNTSAGDGKSFNGTGYLQYDILDYLQFKTAYTSNYSTSENLTFNKAGSTFQTEASRSRSTNENSVNVWENTLKYLQNFGKHDIRGLLGFSTESYNSTGYSLSASVFPDEEILNDFGSASVLDNAGESTTSRALISQFARVHYKYDNRYIISGTIRRDGSSRFGTDRRWGIFPSGAIGWVVSDEDFMKRGNIPNIVSYLKFRASYGITGSQNLGNYDYITQVGSSSYLGNPAITPSSIGNPGLQWEQTELTDIGMDYGFLDDRIRGTLGVYQKKSDKLIYNQPIAPSSSFGNITSNVASIKNKGIEFEIKGDVIRNNTYRLTLGFNAAHNTTRVEKINSQVNVLYFPYSYRPYMVLHEGDLTGEWFGYEYAGRLYATNEEVAAFKPRNEDGSVGDRVSYSESAGDLMYVDQNGDGVINEDDKVKLGSSVPKLFGGFNTTFQFKGLLVSTNFTYSYGNKRLWGQQDDVLGYGGNYNHSNKIGGNSATILDPRKATIPRIGFYGYGSNGLFTDFNIYDASYIRLNTLDVTYRLPNRLFQKSLIHSAEVTFQATNLFTITKYPGWDPQGNFTSTAIGTGTGVDSSIYPSARTFSLGVQLSLQ